MPTSPTFRLTWRLPYAYDPAAVCPRTRGWLLEACRGRADQVEVLRAFLRAVLCGRTDIQRFPELVGPGGSGKGTFTRLAQGLVGLENVAVTELKYLESNRFETSNLIHKRLIIITDAEQWAGHITTLKALTGGDSLRVERKNVQTHPNAVAEGLVLISANEAITSSDYTSGLDRRRIPIPFQHTPPTRRTLLEIKGEHFEGALADEFPGVVNWVLEMSEEEMLRYLLRTSAVAPTLAASHARALVRTNPLAAWADERLTLDPTPGQPVKEDYRPAGVKVGIARLEERSNRYEYEDVWLYPNYVAYCQGTNTKAFSLRRFTDLLLDLLTAQLHLGTVEQKTTKKGSHIFGIRFRAPSDDENSSLPPEPYRPKTPWLITGQPSGTGHPSPGEGLQGAGEESGEGLNGVGYGSEGCKGVRAYTWKREDQHNDTQPLQTSQHDALARACSNGANDPSHPSLPSLARDNPSPDPSPTPHPSLTDSPPTPAEAAPALQSDACPQCHCLTPLILLGDYRECPLCNTRWRATSEHVPPASPAASLQVGDTVRCLNTQGDITNAELLTIAAIVPHADGTLYAMFVETAGGWPLAQCEREPATASPASDAWDEGVV